jgi:hypothetical protein
LSDFQQSFVQKKFSTQVQMENLLTEWKEDGYWLLFSLNQRSSGLFFSVEKDHLTEHDGDFSVEKDHLTERDGDFSVEKDHLTGRDGDFSVEKDHLTGRDGDFSVEKVPLLFPCDVIFPGSSRW